jgi:hypothetical protein
MVEEMPEILAKGPNFVFAREFILKQYGEQTWDRILARLPDDVAASWRNADLDHALPFAAFKAGTEALSAELGSPEIVELAKMYEFIADRSLSTLYKAFFRLTSPAFVIRNYPRLWEMFFNTGKVEVDLPEKNQAIVTFTLPEIFLDWLSPACLGYSQRAVEMAGGKYFAIRQLEKKRLTVDEWQISFKLSWQ